MRSIRFRLIINVVVKVECLVFYFVVTSAVMILVIRFVRISRVTGFKIVEWVLFVIRLT